MLKIRFNLSVRFKYLLYFEFYVCKHLPTCMSVHHVHSWSHGGQKRGSDLGN